MDDINSALFGMMHVDPDLGNFVNGADGYWVLNNRLDLHFQKDVPARFICSKKTRYFPRSLKDNIFETQPLFSKHWNSLAASINEIFESKSVSLPETFFLEEIVYVFPNKSVSKTPWILKLKAKDIAGRVIASFKGSQLLKADFLTFQDLAARGKYGEADFITAFPCGRFGYIPVSFGANEMSLFWSRRRYHELKKYWPKIWLKIETAVLSLLKEYGRDRALDPKDTFLTVELPASALKGNSEWDVSVQFTPFDGVWCVEFEGLDIVDAGVSF